MNLRFAAIVKITATAFREQKNIGKILNIFTIAAKRSGGDFHKIIATTIEHISDKIEVEREVQTVISAKKMEQKIMNVIPVFIILYLNLTSGEFLAPLYGNIFGISVMTGALGAYLAAIKISAKMTAIKV